MTNSAHNAARDGWNILRNTVRPMLVNELADWDIDPEAVYINGIAHDGLVIYSQSLTDVAVLHILERTEPEYADTTSMGLFSAAYSFADAHRVDGPGFEELGEVLRAVIRAHA